MNLPQKTVWNKEILDSVQDWTISLSDLSNAIRKNLDSILQQEKTPIENLPFIDNFNTPPDEEMQERFNKVEEYITNTSSLRANYSWKDSLQESNGKKYLVIDTDNIYEVIEQKWPIYIGYNQIKQTYRVYKFLWDWFQENTHLPWELDKLEKTNIDWYYKVQEDKELGYYYIWENGVTKYLWGYEELKGIYKLWNAVFFKWYNWPKSDIVIYNGEKVVLLPGWYVQRMRSKNGKHMLYLIYNMWSPEVSSILFDLDMMEYILKDIDDVTFSDLDYDVYGVGNVADTIEYHTHTKRTWVVWYLLWSKKNTFTMLL